MHRSEEVVAYDYLCGIGDGSAPDMEDTVVILAVGSAKVIERIASDQDGIAYDCGVHPEEGTDTVGERAALDLEGIQRSLPEIDEVAAGTHIGNCCPADHYGRYGRSLLVLVDQAVLVVPDIHVNQREGVDSGFVHHVECIVHGSCTVESDSLDCEVADTDVELEASLENGSLASRNREGIDQGCLACRYFRALGDGGEVIFTVFEGDHGLACGNGCEKFLDVGYRYFRSDGASACRIPARVSDVGVHCHTVGEGEVTVRGILARVSREDGTASGEARFLAHVCEEGICSLVLAVLAVVEVVVHHRHRGYTGLALELRESGGVGRLLVNEDGVEQVVLYLVAEQSASACAPDVEDTVVVLAGLDSGDLVEGVVADGGIVHLVSRIGADEGTAAVGDRIVDEDEVVVGTCTEVDEVGRR